MKIYNNAPVSFWFFILCLVATLPAQFLGEGWLSFFSVASSAQFSVSNPLNVLGLITHIFGHAGYGHLSSNMTLFLILSPLLEEKYGAKRLIFLFLLVALVTGGINVIFMSHGLLGASGVVFMLIMLSSLAGRDGQGIPLTLPLVALVFLSGEVIRSTQDNQVSEMAHLVGGGIGALVGWLWKKRLV